MRIEHLRFVKILNLTRAESKAIEEATRPITPAELLELASQQPDTLIISKVDGEWPLWAQKAAGGWLGRMRFDREPLLGALLAAQSEEGT